MTTLQPRLGHLLKQKSNHQFVIIGKIHGKSDTKLPPRPSTTPLVYTSHPLFSCHTVETSLAAALLPVKINMIFFLQIRHYSKNHRLASVEQTRKMCRAWGLLLHLRPCVRTYSAVTRKPRRCRHRQKGPSFKALNGIIYGSGTAKAQYSEIGRVNNHAKVVRNAVAGETSSKSSHHGAKLSGDRL